MKSGRAYSMNTPANAAVATVPKSHWRAFVIR
jgi:hypothetical protein